MTTKRMFDAVFARLDRLCRLGLAREAILLGMPAPLARPGLFSLIALLLAMPLAAAAQASEGLYARAFGRATDPAIVFVHGGPGYNAFLFEHTTAEALSRYGFRVIVYDQRGCGRSAAGDDAKYDFDEALADLDAIYGRFNISRAALIGQGFGGTLAMLFAERFPAKVRQITWVGTPVSYPATFRVILGKARTVYATEDPSQLRFIDMLESADRATYDYAYYTQQHAITIGLYRPKQPSVEATRLYRAASAAVDGGLVQRGNKEPMRGFLTNTRYTSLDFAERAADVAARTPIYGIYGAEDGQFDARELTRIELSVGGSDRFVRVPGASHNVYVDNAKVFLDTVTRQIRRVK